MSDITLIPCALVPPEALYEVLSLGGGAAYWRTRGRTVSLDLFRQLLMGEDEASFGVIDGTLDGRVVGHVGLYNCDRISGVASIAAFFDQRLPSPELLAASAIRQFLDYVFDVLGLRKIHIEMPVENLGTLSQSVDRLGIARVEGLFEAHTKIGPDYHDMQHVAVWAEDYAKVRSGRCFSRVSENTDDEPFARVRGILTELGYGPSEAIDGGSKLIDDLGLDSLAVIELIVALEELVGERVEMDRLSPDVCVQDLVEIAEAVHRRGRSRV